jgi:hypothetical protein
MFFFIESEKFDPRNRDRQRSTKIAVEGKIFAFGFSKMYDPSLLSIKGRVLDRCWAFDRLVSVDAHLCPSPTDKRAPPPFGSGEGDSLACGRGWGRGFAE